MKNSHPTFLTILLLSFFSFPIYSYPQTDDEESLEDLLDDGSKQMFLVKTDLLRYLDGNFSFSSEYRIKNLAVEFSYGLQREPIFRPIRGVFWEDLYDCPDGPQSSSIIGGNVLQAGIRRYTPFGPYISFVGDYMLIHVKRNLFKMASGDACQTIEYYLGGGIEYVSDGGFVFDMNLAVGVRQPIGWESDNLALFSISLLLGYRIF